LWAPTAARTLNGDLSEGRHASRPSRKPALIVGGLVAVLVIGVVVVILAGGGDGAAGIIPGIGGDDGPVTPEFAFETTKVLAVPTRLDVTPEELKPQAEPAAQEIETLMDTLYLEAFFDVDNWQEGTYDEVWPLFEDAAAAEAQADAATLTAGTGAGDAFDEIEPGLAQLKTKVLLNHKDAPVSVVAVVIFRATGRGKDGAPDVLMQSNGQFTFRQVDGEWRIVAFHVQRDDEEQTPSASATPSTEPS
jgi:hypothetical protein